MPRTNFKELLEAGVHFGHLRRKWNPNMAPYIFNEMNGIHIIDLNKTVVKLDEAASALKQIAYSGRKILFVATKKQAKDLAENKVSEIEMPYVSERWSGGMLTNFPTVRKAVKKMTTLDKMMSDESYKNISKRERLQVTRQKAKMEKILGSIADMVRLPAALFVIDIQKEKIAVREARKLNIPVFAMVDTNSDPELVDYVIPANDDASKSIGKILDVVCEAIKEGLDQRKAEKEKEKSEKKSKENKKAETAKAKKAEPAKEKKAEPVKAEKKAEPVKAEKKAEEAVADKKEEK